MSSPSKPPSTLDFTPAGTIAPNPMDGFEPSRALSSRRGKLELNHFRISPLDWERYCHKCQQLNVKPTSNIRTLIEDFTHGHGSFPAPTVETVMIDTVPVIICGIPGSGKTFWVENTLIPAIDEEVLVFNPHNGHDYASLKTKQELPHSFGKKAKLAIELDANGTTSAAQMLSYLSTLQTRRNQLSNTVIVFDEAHRYLDDFVKRHLMSFVAEARKFCRKVVVVIQDPEGFKMYGRVYEVKR